MRAVMPWHPAGTAESQLRVPRWHATVISVQEFKIRK